MSARLPLAFGPLGRPPRLGRGRGCPAILASRYAAVVLAAAAPGWAPGLAAGTSGGRAWSNGLNPSATEVASHPETRPLFLKATRFVPFAIPLLLAPLCHSTLFQKICCQHTRCTLAFPFPADADVPWVGATVTDIACATLPMWLAMAAALHGLLVA